MTDIREVIRREADRRAWSAYRLAKEAGLPERTVRSYLRGDTDAAGERIGAMMRALGLRVTRA